MTRPLRIQYPGALYHIIARGNAGKQIFLNQSDYLVFLKLYKKTIEHFEWISYAYCLMPNHYHLFLKTKKANISNGVQKLNSGYAQTFNIINNKYGHVFQGRFKSVLVENLGYSGELIRYIILNPVRAGLTKKIEHWRWTSHRELIYNNNRGCLAINEALSIFHNNKDCAKESYINFIKEKTKEPKAIWEKLETKPILGSDEYAKNIIDKYVANTTEINKEDLFLWRPKLKILLKNIKNKDNRNKLIIKAYFKYKYTQKEIAKHLKLNRSTVSKIINTTNL